jgi:hypothetical protein
LARALGRLSSKLQEEDLTVKYQHVAFKLQEMEAAWEMFDQTRRKVAQVQAALSLGEDGPQADELQQLKTVEDDLNRRMNACERLFFQRTGAKDLEEGLFRMQEVRGRLNQIQERRTEYIALKTELEAELTLGGVSPGDRTQAESVLETQKRRMEVLCQQAEAALPGDRLILL